MTRAELQEAIQREKLAQVHLGEKESPTLGLETQEVAENEDD